MNKTLLLISTFFALTLTGCGLLGGDEGNGQKNADVVARAGTSYLYQRDLTGLVGANMSSEDSARAVDRFVNNWIKEELFIQEAANNLRIDLDEIERKVADYRFKLISFEYERQRVEQQLNRTITPEEVQAYYDANRTNFVLRQNIVRGRYIKLSNEAPKKKDVKRWVKSNRPQDLESLRSYCIQFADNFALEDSTWLKFDEVIKTTPLNTISNKIQFLRRNRYVEEADSAYLYLFRIDEYKISDEISPLEFVRDDIENIIINKRRVALAQSIENEIYERAKENEDFEIYE